MNEKTKKIVNYTIAAIGFISSVIGIWVFVYTPTPDSNISLVDDSMPTISIKSDSDTSTLPNPARANEFVVDGEKITLLKGQVIIANKIILKNGAEISGDSISLIATHIEGGRVTSNGVRDGKHGGDLFIAAAMINGTAIESNGLAGRDGDDGAPGRDGAAGKNGRDGSCKGFGGWRSAQPGQKGETGGRGEDGDDGEDGGDAGNITVLISYQPTILPLSVGGNGGEAGRGGPGGRGGAGGRGGSGCTGLGGAQDGRPNGASGLNGHPGDAGENGRDGATKTPNIKMVDFSEVKRVINKKHTSVHDMVTALHLIKPRDA